MKSVKNTYDEILDVIDQHLTNGEIQSALTLIEEELRLPYIPPMIETKLRQYKSVALSAQKMKEEVRLEMSEEGILAYLKQDDLHQLRALEAFSVMNMRNCLPLVQEAFNLLETRVLKCLLCKLTIEQALTDEFSFSDDGLRYEFIPASLTLPKDCDGVAKSKATLQRWLENDNPTMLKLCLDQLELESLLKLPESIDEDESYSLAYSLLKTVFLMLATQESFDSFVQDKGIQKVDRLALFN